MLLLLLLPLLLLLVIILTTKYSPLPPPPLLLLLLLLLLLPDKFYEIKEELRVLEEKHSNFEKQEHKISVIDLDEILKGLGGM